MSNMNSYHKFILLLFIAHHLGDYYLQNGVLATRKATSYRYTLLHCVLYGLPFSVLWIFLFDRNVYLLTVLAIIVLTHYPIDWMKCYLSKHKIKLVNKGVRWLNDFRYLYTIDQFTHYIFIYVAVYLSKQILMSQSFVYLNNLNNSLLLLIFSLIIGYQMVYVTTCIYLRHDDSISNWYSPKDFNYKLSSFLMSCLVTLFPYGLWILIAITAILQSIKNNKIQFYLTSSWIVIGLYGIHWLFILV